MATVHDTHNGAFNRSAADWQGTNSGIGNMLLWVVFGGIAGWVASIIAGADAGMGILANVLVGIAGAFVGGYIADRAGMGGAEGAERPTGVMSFVWAVIGALILLFIINLFV